MYSLALQRDPQGSLLVPTPPNFHAVVRFSSHLLAHVDASATICSIATYCCTSLKESSFSLRLLSGVTMPKIGQIPPSVTIERISQWKSSGQKFSVEYEFARFDDESGPEYRCCYTLLETGEKFTLAHDNQRGLKESSRLLRDRMGVIQHHRRYGDGRDVLFDQDLEVYLMD